MNPCAAKHDQTTGGSSKRRPSVGWGRLRAMRGFTLLEVILVLTLLALMAAASVPAVRGLRDEAQAREPLNSLARLAKQTRLKAMQDRRPYQIAFTSTGFKATRYLSPYLQAAQIEEFIQKSALESQQKEEAGVDQEEAPQGPLEAAAPGTNVPASGSAPAPAYKEWMESVTLPEGMTCSVQEWYDSEPTPVGDNALKLWVFQPSGMVTPITVTLQLNNNFYKADFSPLTADIVKETSGSQ
ncbi:MAG: prepilin-type N-terminal cleavage/methylation domain-containing protein [Verrucomicrobium sp.]